MVSLNKILKSRRGTVRRSLNSLMFQTQDVSVVPSLLCSSGGWWASTLVATTAGFTHWQKHTREQFTVFANC